MALTPTEQAANARLSQYNGGRYDASTNQRGLAGDGYKTNVPAAFNDTGTVAGAVSRLADEANAAAAVVAPAIPIVTAARDQAVAAAQTAAGIVQHVQPSEIAGIDPVVDFPFRASTAVPSGVITGSSGKWVTNQAGLLTFVPAGTAPIDFDPVTGALRGLLVEESRANLLTYSQQFDNAAWTKAGATVTANAATAPDGTTTADKLVEDSGVGTHNVRQAASGVTSGIAYTASVYAKAAGRTQTRLVLESAGTIGVADYDLTAMTAALSSGTAASIAPAGNGWYRLSLTATTNSTSVAVNVRPNVSGAQSYTGDGASGLYLWQAQAEAGSFATSPAVTTSSTVTRAADVNTVALSSVPGWNASEGTIYVEAAWVGLTGWPGIVSLHDGTNQNMAILFASSNSPNTPRGSIITGGVAQAAELGQTYSAVSSGQYFKAALAWKANDFAFSRDGLDAVADTSGTVPPLTTLQIGAYPGSLVLNGWVRRVTLFPRRLSNATLKLLTA